MPTKHVAFVVSWTEYERGWGCRPDGTSVHTDEAEADRFIAGYNERLKQLNGNSVPHEYSDPTKVGILEISPDLDAELAKTPSIWLAVNDKRSLLNWVTPT